jgi:biofilm protein TabA
MRNKHLSALVICIFACGLLFGTNVAEAQTHTKVCTDKALIKKAKKWMKSGVWRDGFSANPDKSVNAVDFYEQYQKNPVQWKALFKWVTANDLQNIKAGIYPIEGTKMTASVDDSHNEALEKRMPESHYHHIDFQFVVKGTERFGIVDHESSTPNCKYKPDAIQYNYDKSKARFYDSKPDKFFLFFPSDWHIPKVATGKSDQSIRVVVIKVDYID